MSKTLCVLLIEDSEDDAMLLLRELRRNGYMPISERVQTAEAMQAALDRLSWDVILCDYVMPHFSAPSALALLRQSGLDLPFLVVSGAMSEDTAVEMMRAGAHDYLIKDRLARLAPAIEREMQEAANRRARKRAEGLSSRLGRILDNSSNEIYVFDAASHRLLQANVGACQNLGYAAEEIVGMTPLDLQPKMTSERFSSILQPLYAREREQIIFETEHRRRDGSIYPIEVCMTFSYSEKPPVFVAIAQDITERKKSERALYFMAEASTVLSASLDYEATFHGVVELAIPYLADVCVLDVLDEDRMIRRVAAAYRYQAQAPAANQLKQEHVPAANHVHPVANVLRTGNPFILSPIAPADYDLWSANSAERQLLQDLNPKACMVVPLILRERILGAITFLAMDGDHSYDLGEIALAEELARRAAVAIENARLYHETQQALHLRDQFLSIAAHELKTPITALLGNTQLIERRIQRNGLFADRDQRMLQVIGQQARRLSRMVETLLDISRIRTGTLSIERDFLNISLLTLRIGEEMQPSLERHSITINSGDENLVVSGDSLRLEQVFQNLIQNAIKYSPQGGKVILEINRQGDQVCVSVSDQGIGIPPNAIPHLFRQFYRADNVNTHQIAGMGLGLYVVREIIALHGGKVDVKSIEGQGSTFYVYLPLARDHQSPSNSSRSLPQHKPERGTPTASSSAVHPMLLRSIA